VSYTTASQSIPSLFSLPSASAANTTFQNHQSNTQTHLVALSLLPITAYGLAFTLAPKEGGRHPYLLWTGLVVIIGSSVDYVLAQRDDARHIKEAGSSKADADEYVDINGSMTLNGEGIRKSMEEYRVRKMVQTAISGVAFTMGVVGIWGDGVGWRTEA
jgi:autophagy-related protein 33